MSKIKLGGSSKSAEAPATTSTQNHIRRANSYEPPSGNFLLAFLVGALAAAACAYAWGFLSFRQQIHIGYLAVGTGILLGLAVRFLGRGSQSVYGMTGATLTLVACVAGNLVTMCMVEGQEKNVDWLALFRNLKVQPVLDWWKPRFQPVHLLFYGGALILAHRLAYKRVA